MKSRRSEPKPLRPWGQSSTRVAKPWVHDKIQGMIWVGMKSVLGESEVPVPCMSHLIPPVCAGWAPSYPCRDTQGMLTWQGCGRFSQGPRVLEGLGWSGGWVLGQLIPSSGKASLSLDHSLSTAWALSASQLGGCSISSPSCTACSLGSSSSWPAAQSHSPATPHSPTPCLSPETSTRTVCL